MTNPEASAPDWLADAVFYQIFPERFANGDPSTNPTPLEPWGGVPTPDNFFGGDLKGITDHLDHIESLGANAIYLTPIFAAGTNHRYDARDYFTIDPALGDLSAFRTFLAEAHSRGIRVVLDAVLNHSGDSHWAFRDVVAREADSDYVNWYSIEDFPVRTDPEPNYLTCSGCYYLPKWNAYNPQVRDHHYRVAKYWIEQGIDGWRLDVPYFINDNFWRGFRKTVKEIDNELYIVAEEWREPEHWLQGDLADGTMNYTLRDLVLGFTADRTISAAAYAQGMTVLHDRIPQPARHAMLNLLGSHDTERVLTRHNESMAATFLAYTLLLTAQGAPMVYYGDEVGLVGATDPACRGTMPWDESTWSQDLLGWIRGLITLRSELTALRRGNQHVAALGDDTVLVLRDAGEDGAVLAIINRGDIPVVLPPSALSGELFGVRIAPGATWTAVLGAATAVPPHSSGILASDRGGMA